MTTITLQADIRTSSKVSFHGLKPMGSLSLSPITPSTKARTKREKHNNQQRIKAGLTYKMKISTIWMMDLLTTEKSTTIKTCTILTWKLQRKTMTMMKNYQHLTTINLLIHKNIKEWVGKISDYCANSKSWVLMNWLNWHGKINNAKMRFSPGSISKIRE